MARRTASVILAIAVGALVVIFLFTTASEKQVLVVKMGATSAPQIGLESLIFNGTGELLKRRGKGVCISGLLTNMEPVCGQGCLRTLTGLPPASLPKIPDEQRKHIKDTRGWMSMLHVDFVETLTKMQWDHGIFGSVGEIGVYWGRYSSVLASFTNTDLGERMFICDIFDNPKYRHLQLKPVEARKEGFEENMKKIGFSLFAKDEAKRVRIFDDSSLLLSNTLYTQMGLPAFRFYSIDGSHNHPYVFNDIRQVACALRPGGIIAIDDAKNKIFPEVNEAIRQFMSAYGDKVIQPLIFVANKLYLCTSDFCGEYKKYIDKKRIAKALKLKLITTTTYGPKFTYYSKEW